MGGLVGPGAANVPQELSPRQPSLQVLQLAGLGERFALRGEHEWVTSQRKTALLRTCEDWVKAEIAECDASHDWAHVHRVRQQAVNIAQQEELEANIPGGMLVVELAALLHDVKDYKYSGSDSAGIEAAANFLKIQQVPPDFIARILHVVENVSYKKELAALPKLGEGEFLQLCPVTELACVQDADRLDAIGAVGIARCFTFGGAMKRVLYDSGVPPRSEMSAAMYQDGTSTTLNHFHEKLLKLRCLMKTATGRQMASSRHEYMLQFLQQFQSEIGL